MKENTKPQALNLGNRMIDGESITANVTSIDSLTAKSQWVFGKSSPMITDYDIAEHDLFPDAHFCNSFTSADQHLRAQGLIPAWASADKIRFHRHQWMHRSWRKYAGAR